MEFYLYDENLVMTGMIDDAVSAIWTPRYYNPGDFELYLRASSHAVKLLGMQRYVKRADMDSLCVIEHIEIQEDEESGDHYIIPGLALGPDSGFAETMAKQITGANLMEAVSDICRTYQWGWDIIFSNGTLQLIFYKGADRSYGQTDTDNPYVVFSAEFDNLISSIYTQDISQFKNVALVAGEGEGKARKKTIVGEASGMDRYELYVDARDVSSNEGEISETDYMAQLYGRGLEKLEAASLGETFEGEVDNTNMYIYGEDYFLGDIVAVKNKYGITGNARVVEMIECWDENGYTAVPTFETFVERGTQWQ